MRTLPIIIFMGFFLAILIVSLMGTFSADAHSTWRGLTIAAENRCSPYSAGDYRYGAYVEADIVAAMGGYIYEPYTGTHFSSSRETDIEHIVARSEAHDSGLCDADATTRRAFAEDLDNLTLASPSVNRHQKSSKDAAEWMPETNQCWFADRVVKVRQKYELTVDQLEADALEAVLSGCTSLDMVVVPDPDDPESESSNCKYTSSVTTKPHRAIHSEFAVSCEGMTTEEVAEALRLYLSEL